MHLFAILVLTASTFITDIRAQTGAQNSSIPDCIRACDTLAISAAKCGSMDQYCHCVNVDTIYEHIIPCVYPNSTCGVNSTADILVFEELFGQVCEEFNITIPTNITSVSSLMPSATESANGTVLATSTVSPTAYTGAAALNGLTPSREMIAGGLVGLLGLVCVL
ncbi:hypothetical protein BDV97DRAFT_227680 [Delphinella strobiligena]|nr:hypothetical protein BDV97DRAFT_227680 [Delphinella strobiligena]